MLLAGGCANDANTLGGSLVFNVLNNQIMGFWGTGFALLTARISIVYYIYGNNRWNRLTLFHLLFISLIERR